MNNLRQEVRMKLYLKPIHKPAATPLSSLFFTSVKKSVLSASEEVIHFINLWFVIRMVGSFYVHQGRMGKR